MSSAVEPLRYPQFRWLWAGNVFSASGTFVQAVAASWLMWELTGSSAWVGWIVASSTLPLLFFSLQAGALAEEFGTPLLVYCEETLRAQARALKAAVGEEQFKAADHLSQETAIIVHGTMCLIRRSAIADAGGWSSRTIVEDTDLGLTLLEQGWQVHYTNRRYGHGLLPDTYEAYKKQRHRWAYGGFQILRHHWRHLLPRAPGLTRDQKREYALGWLNWLGAESLGIACQLGVDGLNVGSPPSGNSATSYVIDVGAYNSPLGPPLLTNLVLTGPYRVADVEIHRQAVGLGHVPRGVDQQLHAVFFRIVEVDRKRIAVSYRSKVHHRLVLETPMELAQCLQAVHSERELIDDVERQLRRPAAHHDELMVLARVTSHEHDLAVRARAPIAHCEPQKARIEIHHALHVGDVNADVAQGERKRHGCSPQLIR